jgi:hypothetical protein
MMPRQASASVARAALVVLVARVGAQPPAMPLAVTAATRQARQLAPPAIVMPSVQRLAALVAWRSAARRWPVMVAPVAPVAMARLARRVTRAAMAASPRAATVLAATRLVAQAAQLLGRLTAATPPVAGPWRARRLPAMARVAQQAQGARQLAVTQLVVL